AHELLIEPTEGRAAVTGDIARGVEPGAAVELLLHQAKAHQRLIAGRKDAALAQVELVVERDACGRHSRKTPRPVCPRGATAARGKCEPVTDICAGLDGQC